VDVLCQLRAHIDGLLLVLYIYVSVLLYIYVSAAMYIYVSAAMYIYVSAAVLGAAACVCGGLGYG